MDIEILVEICKKGAILPKYAKPGDAGMDVFAAEDTIIKPGETVIVSTGIKMAIPRGYEIQVRPRSGISYNTPLRIANTPGTIDSGYRGELGIIINNLSPINFGENNSIDKLLTLDSQSNKAGPYKICKGDRIAQIVLQKVPKMKLTVVNSIKDEGEDRGGGFGSTGL
jgi:dUTP pyrophosphatase